MNRVAIVGGVRTPFVKAAGAFASQSNLDLATHAVTSLVRRFSIDPSKVDELAFSTVLLDPRISNIAREVVLRSNLPKSIVAHSVSNNCVSGLAAVAMVADGIRSGRLRRAIAGGSESMSRPALTFTPAAERFFLSLFRARTFSERMQVLAGFRPGFLAPQAPSPKEPSTGKTMGQHCELTAQEMKVPRETQDIVAFRSHQNAARAQEGGILGAEIEPLSGVEKDNLIRKDTSLEKLAKLKPVFDRRECGSLTAGNSSALTDGASAVYLMSEEAAREEGREVLAFIEGIHFAALAPDDGLLMAPAIALPQLLRRHGVSVQEIDLFEIHEAFGAQVAANISAWENGWHRHPEVQPIGKIPEEKINVNGGSIAIGHPFAATGGRLLTAAANELKRSNKRTAVISICAAGAMAGAVLLRRG